MHDFHLADKILKLVLEEAQKNNFKKVLKIKIGLGKIIEHGEQISPENLEYNLKLLSKGTIAEKCAIKIDSFKGGLFVLDKIVGEK
ncbi:MAG: hydrogenase/urease maturation nickel metallochaperone HypA [Patescibacteria group bacterium]